MKIGKKLKKFSKAIFYKMKKTNLLLGSSGFLGSSLILRLNNTSYNVLTHSLKKNTDFNVDLRIKKKVFKLLLETQPDFIINLVAETNVDLCEKDPKRAFITNVQTVVNITDYMFLTPKKFIYYKFLQIKFMTMEKKNII